MQLPPFRPEGCPGGAEAGGAGWFPYSAWLGVWPGLGKSDSKSQDAKMEENTLASGRKQPCPPLRAAEKGSWVSVSAPLGRRWGVSVSHCCPQKEKWRILGVRLARTWQVVGHIYIFFPLNLPFIEHLL